MWKRFEGIRVFGLFLRKRRVLPGGIGFYAGVPGFPFRRQFRFVDLSGAKRGSGGQLFGEPRILRDEPVIREPLNALRGKSGRYGYGLDLFRDSGELHVFLRGRIFLNFVPDSFHYGR